ncbi:hypothetical protein ACQP1W_32315 [Spirillospora sp. CA-255316]
MKDLRRRLAEVQSRLEAEEHWLSQLEITQETMSKILGEAAQIAKVEGLRGKLKRLTERGWLTEGDPGMFALVEPVRRQVTRDGGSGPSP